MTTRPDSRSQSDFAPRARATSTVLDCEQEPTRLLDAWEGADVALVIDAAASGAVAAGTVHRFDASGEGVPARVFRSSTHAFGVGDAVELARALGTAAASVSSSTASRERTSPPAQR